MTSTTFIISIYKALRNFASFILPILSVAGFLLLIFDFGFSQSDALNENIKKYYSQLIILAYILIILRLDYKKLKLKRFGLPKIQFYPFLVFSGVWIYQYILPLVFPAVLFSSSSSHYFIDAILIIFLFISELSVSSLNISKVIRNPAFVFIFSFALVILAGTGLLLLPNATFAGIIFTDALFTSTSAVCVTGLIVVDTAHHFTPFGQNIILLLIQIGGLGILTFTSFFGMYLRTSISYQDQLMLGSMNNEEQLSNILKTIVRIIILTLSVEIISAIFIYHTLEPALFSNRYEQARFAIFHSISAFCNAGFSLLSDGLYDINYRTNYWMQLIIIFLIVTGGLGFTIIFNYLKFIKYNVVQRFHSIKYHKKFTYLPRIININSKIVIATTIGLIIFGFVMNIILEWNNTLADRSFTGKIITSLFASVTPRTAGFNTINMMEILPSTILIYFLLMLIGGSPGSTAGGIKTTTFAVAAINAISLAKGKDRVEIFRREVSAGSLRRALSVISLALLFIGASIFIITLLQPEFGLTSVIFECISAFSTVGLSLGITPLLSDASKYILIFTMFVGRIGTLTLIVAMFKKVKTLNYNYPSESILIS